VDIEEMKPVEKKGEKDAEKPAAKTSRPKKRQKILPALIIRHFMVIKK
jgi:hypothetical protein